MIKQFVPEEVCLKCLGCCRFAGEDSAWAPCFLDEEIIVMLNNNIHIFPLTKDKRVPLAYNAKQDNFYCSFLNPQDNKCSIYHIRPWECRLYPFLINKEGQNLFLAVHLDCPFVKENLDNKKFKEYVKYLSGFLNGPVQRAKLKNNPQIIRAYEEIKNLSSIKV